MKVYAAGDFRVNKLKEHIFNIVNNLNINFDMTLEVTN
jgi:hypothetical protein